MFASICESTTQYSCAYLFPPGSAPVTVVKPPCALDLEFFHPHHLNLPPGHPKVTILPRMNEISTTPPPPNVLPDQDFRNLGTSYWENMWLLVPDVLSSFHTFQQEHLQPSQHEFKIILQNTPSIL
ncbi:hypothetical protein DSO57_1010277 [Entomophthora muscae]|uniref:Uncharacterized protein n=1 Tax=Entomophthora muscae TaxID=34485 RepID=A0ACC2T6I8_9FUNG|nr:hypothetical protein DSO57_1010277 [Entomophthora muscae]